MFTGKDYVSLLELLTLELLTTVVVPSPEKHEEIEQWIDRIGDYIANCIDHSEELSK